MEAEPGRRARAFGNQKGHGHEAVDGRAGRFLGMPGFPFHFAIETSSAFGKETGGGLVEKDMRS
jgi:hypothetical protein